MDAQRETWDSGLAFLKEALDTFNHSVCGERDRLVHLCYGKRNGNPVDFVTVPCDDQMRLA
jgi:hypothetical protein